MFMGKQSHTLRLTMPSTEREKKQLRAIPTSLTKLGNFSFEISEPKQQRIKPTTKASTQPQNYWGTLR